jgi:hypothetical protein
MAILNYHVTCSDVTAQRLVGSDNMPHDVVIHNATKSSNEYIWIGGSSATAGTADGMHIDQADTIYMTLRPGDELWCTSTPNGLIAHVVDIRRND